MKDKLIKLVDTLDTRLLAKIFKEYMEQKEIRKFDARRKDNNNSYFTYGKDEGWDRVYCIYYNSTGLREIDITFRKRAGLYLIITSGARTIFDYNHAGGKDTTYYDDVLFNNLYKEHKEFFDKLFNL